MREMELRGHQNSIQSAIFQQKPTFLLYIFWKKKQLLLYFMMYGVISIRNYCIFLVPESHAGIQDKIMIYCTVFAK